MPENKCDSCAIRNRAVCGELSSAELSQLNAISRFKDFVPGDVIYRDDDVPTSFANVVHGVVKLTKSLADGRQQIVGLQFASHFLGRPFGERSQYAAIATTPVRLCTFSRSEFSVLTERFPRLEQRLFKNALFELDAARDWMLLLGRKTATEKLASFLSMVAVHSQQQDCHACSSSHVVRFELPLTRSEIADYLGLTIETVSRQLSKLKSKGIIRLEGQRGIAIDHIATLTAIGGDSGGERDGT